MKKFITLLLALSMIIGLAACAAPAQAPSETPAQTEAATPSPTAEPTPEPTPTPTLSPEEIERQKLLKEIQTLYRYYEDYDDYWSFFRIKEIYAKENLPKDDLLQEIEDFLNDFLNDDYDNELGRFAYYAALLNGRYEKISEMDYGWFLGDLVNHPKADRLFLCFFDHQEQRDRVEAGVKIIEKFVEDPSDENTKTYEELILSDELTDEERLFLLKWENGRSQFKDISKEGKIYDFESYLLEAIFDKENNLSYTKYLAKIEDIIFKRNNTPNAEGEMTYDEMIALLS